ncbi:uncharacterized protein LOC113008516, partial [Tachysurus ichikawai]
MRGLSPPETRYLAQKLEFLALKWAVTDKFHDHLYGRKFFVLTDNNPMQYVMTSAKLDATGQRWVSYQAIFDIKYQRGQDNSNADTFSHMYNQEVVETLQITFLDMHRPTPLGSKRQAQRPGSCGEISSAILVSLQNCMQIKGATLKVQL